MVTKEGSYKVVWPLGKLSYQSIALKPRPSDLRGKTVCELSDYGFRAEEIFPIIRKSLKKKYPGINFIDFQEFGNTHGAREEEVIAGLAENLRKHGCDAAISGVGG